MSFQTDGGARLINRREQIPSDCKRMDTFSGYDMNPTLNEYQSLLVSSTSNKAELSILLDTCEDYMLNRKIAEKIISEVIEVVKRWREIATRLSISKREIELFVGVLNVRWKNCV